MCRIHSAVKLIGQARPIYWKGEFGKQSGSRLLRTTRAWRLATRIQKTNRPSFAEDNADSDGIAVRTILTP